MAEKTLGTKAGGPRRGPKFLATDGADFTDAFYRCHRELEAAGGFSRGAAEGAEGELKLRRFVGHEILSTKRLENFILKR